MAKDRGELVMSIAITVAALAIAVSVIIRTINPPASGEARTAAGAVPAAEEIANWSQVLEFTIHVGGRSDAPVQIVEFTDFECPACRGLHSVLQDLLASRPEDIALRYAAFPLTMHRFAYPAARAMECADSSGNAAAFLDAGFSVQDSLGLLSWGQIANRAGLSDTSRISRCAVSPARFARIEGSHSIGAATGVSATPTLWINGLAFTGGLPLKTLEDLVTALVTKKRE